MPAEQAAAKRDIGFVSEDMRLYGAATLAWHMEFIALHLSAMGPALRRNLLRRFDLKPQQKIKGLSHGQRVKAALLLALARQPRLLVLDEPTTGLDPVARREVLAELMAVLADEDRTILFSSQTPWMSSRFPIKSLSSTAAGSSPSKKKKTFLDRWRRSASSFPPDAPYPSCPA